MVSPPLFAKQPDHSQQSYIDRIYEVKITALPVDDFDKETSWLETLEMTVLILCKIRAPEKLTSRVIIVT